jgi:polygalacturonase
MKILYAILLFLSLTLRAAELDVRNFGAVADGKTDCTAAIQKALDAANGTGDTVDMPPGTYLSKPLTIYSETTLRLEKNATLLASPVPADYLKHGGNWLEARSSGEFTPFIGGSDLTNVTITGNGIIDGNGAVWWPEAEKARRRVSGYTLPRPNLIGINRAKNLRLDGIRLINSPKFHFVPADCENVVVEHVTIVSPAGAANTDGIDPSNCRNVTVSHCTIDTGDDDIAIKSGRKVQDREFGCENITVTDCTFLHGHGLSIGSETTGGVRGVTVKNCTFSGTENGIRIKSRRGKGGLVQDLSYSDITMTNVYPAISIACYYQDSSQADFTTNDQAQPVNATTPVFRNIHVRNLTAYSLRDAGLIIGLPESPVADVIFKNVHIFANTGITIVNAKSIQFIDSTITVKRGGPDKVYRAEVTGLPILISP